MRWRVLRVALAVMVMAMLLAGCESAPVAAVLRPGAGTDPQFVPAALARYAGYFDQSGLALQYLDPAAKKQATSKEKIATPDFADMTLRQLLVRRAQGEAWQMIAFYTTTPDDNATCLDLAGMAVRPEVLRHKPQAVRRMVAGLILSYRFLQSHSPEETMTALPKHLHPDDDVYLSNLKDVWERLSPLGLGRENCVGAGIKAAVGAGLLPVDTTLAPSDVMDLALLRKAWGPVGNR